jgi:hypothetical protein
MINNSISGTSLAFVVLMFLSSFSGCAKLISKCSNCADTAGDIAKSSNKLHNLKDLETYNHNMKTLVNLYEKYKEVNIGHGLKLVLPDITRRIDDTRGYDNLFEIQDETNHFFVKTKSIPIAQKSQFERWVEFKEIAIQARIIMRSYVFFDSLCFHDETKGIQTKAYQYFLNSDTIQGMVKMIEANDSCFFIEIEPSKTESGFYEFSEMFLKAAIVFEPKKYVSDSVWRQGS